MASVKGCLEATSEVSFIYEHGLLGAAKDDQAALSYLKIAAEGGHARCTWRLATAFKDGDFGLPKDLDEAALYMMRAEALGSEFAGFELAKACESAPCYGLGSSVPRDDAKAVHLYAKYERHRMTAARVQFRLGVAHERGELGFSIDNSKALEYYERAIVGGSYAGTPEALFRLAKAHELGELGKEVDWEKAVGYYKELDRADFNKAPEDEVLVPVLTFSYHVGIARKRLAQAYEKGELGLEVDAAEAGRLFEMYYESASE